MRFMMPISPRLTLLAVLAACQGPGAESSGFLSAPVVMTPAAQTGDTAADSTGASAGSSSTSSTSTSGGTGTGETTLVLDVGVMPDLGSGTPLGCKGKIDLLFVISRTHLMENSQLKLINAFPKFIDTIESRFDDFDYHIMVIDGDDEWGSEHCNNHCPVPDCKIGEPCCSSNDDASAILGDPCCGVEDYPCWYLDALPECETKIGTGSVFPAGHSTHNKPCPIEGGRRYMVKGQKDLAGTFACAAQVGLNGLGKLGEALTAAMQKQINKDPAGCNRGFLRDDALLMVTFIQANPDHGGGYLESEGFAEDWAKAVLDAKHGDPESVVMLAFGSYPKWEGYDEIWRMAKMFPYSQSAPLFNSLDLGPAFEEAAGMVEAACAGYVAPG